MTTKVPVLLWRGLLAVLVLLLLLVVLGWTSLNWFIVPRIDDFRPQLAAWASRRLDAQVSVQRLSAHADGWLPALQVRGLSVADEAGQPGLQAPRVDLTFSLRSLLAGQPDSLRLQQPEIWLRRGADGRVRFAGIALDASASEPEEALGRLLAWPSLVLDQGHLHWVDAARDHEQVLDNVHSQLHRQGRQRTLELSAGSEGTPVLALQARVRGGAGALFGRTDAWQGRLQWQAEHLPLAELADTLGWGERWGLALQAGTASIHGKATVRASRQARVQARVALQGVQGRLGPELPALRQAAVGADLDWQRDGGRAQLQLERLRLGLDDDSLDGLVGATARLDYALGPAAEPTHLRLRQLDLQAVAGLATHLPLPGRLRTALHDGEPTGRLQQLDLHWQGPLRAPTDWQAQGEVAQLAWQARPAQDAETRPGVPGVDGLDLAFEAQPDGGRARLEMAEGHARFPGVFEDPDIALDRLRADASWQLQDGEMQVTVSDLELANADASGQFSGHWRTARAGDGTRQRLPGFLDLRGHLSRGDGARVHRYLPLVLPAEARHYVRDAIVQGHLSDVQVRVHGLIDEVPFNLPDEDGVFSIAGQVDDGIMQYVPPRFQEAGEAPWPALGDLSGELAFEAASMRVRQASAQVPAHPGWSFADIDADIDDFDDARVTVKASGQGQLETALDIVRASPLSALTDHALDDAHGRGDARLQLALDLPLDDLGRTGVDGRVQLQQNGLDLGPAVPPLQQVTGSIAFSDHGLAIEDVQAQALGGRVTVAGGYDDGSADTTAPLHIQVQGQASAEGLQEAAARPAFAAWLPLAERVHGSTHYALALDFADARLQAAALDSPLQGLQLQWPEPLHKAADTSWPLRLHWQHAPGGDGRRQLTARLADRLDVALAWPAAPEARPQGQVLLGRPAPDMPQEGDGVGLAVKLDTLDVDAWKQQLQALLAAPGASDAGLALLPDRLVLELGQLRLAGHALADVQASAQRRGQQWQGDIRSPDLAGHLQYHMGRPGQSGHLVGRLSRLRVNTSADDADEDASSAADLPSLDLRADQFSWNGLALGQLDLRARRADQGATGPWRLDELVLVTPEARLQAHGSSGGGAGEQTALDFDLSVDDAGQLLARLGQDGVMAGGRGTLAGKLSWGGSPLAFGLAKAAGQMQLDMTQGRFLKLEPGAGKLFGVLSLQALPRRLMLDFKDVFLSGFAFDRLQANARLDQGLLATDDLEIQGVSAAVAMSGQVDVQDKTQDLRIEVQPKLDAGAAALAATAVNPALGAAAFIAQLALREPLGRASARRFHVTGSWDEPEVEALDAPPPPSDPAPATNGSRDFPTPAAGENNP